MVFSRVGTRSIESAEKGRGSGQQNQGRPLTWPIHRPRPPLTCKTLASLFIRCAKMLHPPHSVGVGVFPRVDLRKALIVAATAILQSLGVHAETGMSSLCSQGPSQWSVSSPRPFAASAPVMRRALGGWVDCASLEWSLENLTYCSSTRKASFTRIADRPRI